MGFVIHAIMLGVVFCTHFQDFSIILILRRLHIASLVCLSQFMHLYSDLLCKFIQVLSHIRPQVVNIFYRLIAFGSIVTRAVPIPHFTANTLY